MSKKRFLIIAFSIIIIFLFYWLKGCLQPELPQDPYINLYLAKENTVIKLRLEEYLVGCVAAEMPASFELEALKAQAVCARTYAIRKLLDNHKYPHGADLTDDITTCQAYISAEEFYDRHPQNSKKLLSKVKTAVSETKGMVMLYDDKPIDALYHSTCGGKTASSEEVWGNKVAYLQAKNCPYCQDSKHYSSVQVFSYTDLNNVLGTKVSVDSSIKVNHSNSGRALEIWIGNTKISAAKFRAILNLPSTWVNFTNSANKITINSRGYGHGVGMCQYGANGIAKEGANYQEILNYYYNDIDIYKINY